MAITSALAGLTTAELIGGGVMGLGLVGTGIGAYSAYQSGKAAKQQARAQAEQLREQARVANEKAGIAQVQAEEEQAKRSRQLAADIGSTYANWAGNGLSTGGGADTLGNLLTTQVAEGVSDIDTIKDNGAMAVWTYQSQANAAKAGAKNALTAGSNAMKAGILSAWGTGISGTVSSVGAGMSTYSGLK